MFPLKLVVFPGEKLNLHIFEPRYKELIQDCIRDGKTFGIPSFINDHVSELGTEVKVESVSKTYEDGKMDIHTRGTAIVRILEFLKEIPDKQYPAAVVQSFENQMDSDVKVSSVLFGYLTQLYELLRLGSHGYTKPSEIRSFDIAHKIGMNIKDEYQLLNYSKETDRQKFIVNHLKNVIKVLLQTEQLKRRISMNGHFREEIPPPL